MAKADPLFTEDSEFLKADTRGTRWAIPYSHECLNARTEVLLNRNADCIQGKRILDIASHIGTLSWAALQFGAEHVHGVDTEQQVVDTAHELFTAHNVSTEKYAFEIRDVFELLESTPPNHYDTVFCFGMLYYTAEPYRLLKLMQRAAKECILLDTFTAAYAALQGKDALTIGPHITDAILELPLTLTTLTQSEKKDYSLPDSFEYNDKMLSQTTFPSRAQLEIWFQSLGLSFDLMDWADYIQRPCHWRDLMTPAQKKASHWADVYSSGVRVAYRLEPIRD